MLLLAAALSAAAAPPSPVRPDRQAKASVRIIRAEPLQFREIERTQAGRLRSITVRSANGAIERLRVVEYN